MNNLKEYFKTIKFIGKNRLEGDYGKMPNIRALLYEADSGGFRARTLGNYLWICTYAFGARGMVISEFVSRALNEVEKTYETI
jgi:hypothetical protein